MSTFVCAIPPWWGGVLGPALEAAGHTLVDANGRLELNPALLAAATIDLRKGLGCVVEAPLRRELEGLCARLGDPLARACGVYSNARSAIESLLVQDRAHCLLVTTCTYDPSGRALAAVAQHTGVPLVHVAHACQAGPPAACWYAGEVPGDWLLVPGERDAAWWRACCAAQNTSSHLLVTGHPLWDAYAALPWRPESPPVLIWLAESGANPAMQQGTWRSRAVPQRAWVAFLAALTQLTAWEWRLCLKTRQGEDAGLVAQWTQQAREWLPGREVLQTDAWLQEVLPTASVVVGQDSNGLVEAAHLGIPGVSITRRGQSLFAAADPVLVVDGEQPTDVVHALLAAALDELLRRPPGDQRQSKALQQMAARYNAGAADGQSLARTVAALQYIAADPATLLGQQQQLVQQEVA